jgi:hypothetical protein
MAVLIGSGVWRMMVSEQWQLSRRAALGGAVAMAVLPTLACSKEPSTSSNQESGRPSMASRPPMTVHKDPGCPCCDQIVEQDDMPGIKRRLGVPHTAWSCHTTEVAGLAIEGHVPLLHVQEALASRTPTIAGLAVRGMPRGSPGMEMPDGSKDAFDVLAFDKHGNTRVFAKG